MTNYCHAFRIALGALWSAGYQPTLAERANLHSKIGYSAHTAEAAIAALDALGHKVLNPLANPDAWLAPTTPLIPLSGPPTAGHAVKLSSPIAARKLSIIEPGQYFILQGLIGADRRAFPLALAHQSFTLMRSRADLGHAYISLSNGGPATIASYATDHFVPTDEVVPMTVWDFAFGPEAHSAIYFTVRCPVWTWNGDENDALFSPKSDAPSQWTPALQAA